MPQVLPPLLGWATCRALEWALEYYYYRPSTNIASFDRESVRLQPLLLRTRRYNFGRCLVP